MILRIRTVFLFACMIGCSLMTSHAKATVIQALDLPDLVIDADHILVVTALSNDSRWDDRGRIVTDVVLRIDESVLGNFQVGDEIVVTHLGGVIGNLGMHVAGVPKFKEGGSAVVFLHDNPELGELRVVGMSQGVFHVLEDKDELLAVGGGRGLTLVQQTTKGGLEMTSNSHLKTCPLHELLWEIRQLISESDTP